MPEAGTKAAGLLILDKPVGITSRTAVDRALGWFRRGTRGGHAGTLDPAASGVLVLCLGTATRLAEYVQRMNKTYVATVRLGARSDTDDAEGVITIDTAAKPPSAETVASVLEDFVGEILQVPPAFSAAKVDGRRAYDLARRGSEVSLTPRKVQVFRIHVHNYQYPSLEIEVLCGKGTYIRSLARDLGQRLGCGALLESLRRTRIGAFDVAQAVPLDADADTARSRLLSLSRATADLPSVAVGPDVIKRLTQGRPTALPTSANALLSTSREVAVLDQLGALAAVAIVDESGQMLLPRKVFAHDEPAR
jgi:tRNA pseudouridine55 synthase